MTVSHRILIASVSLFVAFAVTFGVTMCSYQIARAQPGSGSAVVELPGSAAVPQPAPAAAPVVEKKLPSSQLADPLTSPQQSYNDLKAAKRLGWGVFALALLIVGCRLAGKLGGWFKPLATGRVAVVVAGIGAVAIAAYNALALGGTWMSAGAAALVAMAVFYNSTAKPKATEGN